MEPKNNVVLVTGGAGFIGSHTVIELLAAGYELVVMDNLCNANEESLKRVQKISGKTVPFEKVDLRDEKGLERIFSTYNITSVIHFAGLKAVGESNTIPLEYYDNNVCGTVLLLRVMAKHNVKNIVFSSSATVYGEPATVPITEDFPLSATNPYGRTKLMVEDIMRDLYKSDPKWNIILLRYFNPVGAHTSGLIGEDPRGTPNNLLPYITQTAVGKRECVSVYGNDYKTVDGTGVRDYIHVVDLAKGHIAALKKLPSNPGCIPVNLGTGKGYSVLQMVEAMKKASGKEIPYKIVPRRFGDTATCYADPANALKTLGWKAEKGLEEMCADAWRWQSQNPNGFASN